MGRLQPPDVLLAKNQKDPLKAQPRETLEGHTQDVVNSFRKLFGAENRLTRLANRWLCFFQLDPQGDAKAFLQHGMSACAWHDVGKANSGFQEAVRSKTPQVIRHEHLSGLLLWLPEIRGYIREKTSLNLEVLTAAVIGHHLKAGREEFAAPVDPNRRSFLIYPEAIQSYLLMLAGELGSEPPPALAIGAYWSFEEKRGSVDMEELRNQVLKEMHTFTHRLRTSERQKRLLLAVRAGLIVADSAGSGLSREGKDLREWLQMAFDASSLLDGEAIEEKIIQPRIEQLIRQRGKFEWNDFQLATDSLPERALLIAPCGSGKTLAAWRWIKACAGRYPRARAIFLYPTRATATEGFRDYVSWAPEADAALIHGTATYELADLFENPQDSRYGKDFTTNDRLFALGYWPRKIFSATVDQFLGFMQHVYSSTCLMPLLADGIVVIDEVHSFDKSLFSSLKRFLKGFDIPVLCMTASLPEQRRQELEECGLLMFPSDPGEFADLQEKATMPRYQVRRIAGEEQARTIAIQALNEGKKVLWVVNTVARCQRIASALEALCYHSRFRLQDRKERHKEVISAFQENEGLVLAITTQVCEMSLDLDADVLISEEAPITALIQRLGRCNRHASPGNNKTGQVFIYPPEKQVPYKPEEWEGTGEFLGSIEDEEVSQAWLQELLEQFGPRAVEVERYAAFLESGPWASSREETLREDQDFTVPAVLDGDVERYLALQEAHRPVDGLLVAVPRRFARRED
ncbi:MAG: CRISPR-associated helicase Cas3', partial [Candidatus Latescibacteria bacterium]|nr:CRISPR-associated helicase Cas3' [Candidatus Latescibacterota bacterium]